MKIEINFNSSEVLDLINGNIKISKNLQNSTERKISGSEILDLLDYNIEKKIEKVEIIYDIKKVEFKNNQNNSQDAYKEIIDILEKIKVGINEFVDNSEESLTDKK